MASTITPPSLTRRWTRVEYERLVELGVFRPDERLELLDGALIVSEFAAPDALIPIADLLP